MLLPTVCQAQQGGEDRVLTTADGWPIHITYYESSKGKESPAVILVPGVEGIEGSMTRRVWDGVAGALQKNGFAVVTADLRKHGDSVPPVDESERSRLTRLLPADYTLMVTQDMTVIKDFLVNEHQKEKLNIRKLGIAAAGSSGLVVTAFAANDWLRKPWPDAPTLAQRTPRGQDVRAILMLSPKSSVRGLSAASPLRLLADPAREIAFHIYYNPEDRAEKSSAEKLFRFLKLKDENDARRIIEGPPDKAFSAEGLLQGKAAPVMEKNITEFFDTYVKGRNDPWQTRTSKLQ
ncbi:MAG: hypothetical protein RIK87_26535 [Fuerstiella sp.]